jgi:hypothetical protein
MVKEGIALKVPIDVSLAIFENMGNPTIQIRKTVSDWDLMKHIISAAFEGNAIMIRPVFNDRLKAINALIDKGIMYRDGDTLFFTV